MRDSWLKKLNDKCSEEQLSLLKSSSDILLNNIIPPFEDSLVTLPWHPWRGICPAPSRYLGVWNWDSAFHAISISRWDTQLAREQILIFLEKQQPDGSLIDHMRADGTWMGTAGKPPVMAWAAEIVDRRDPDDDFIAFSYDRFKKHEHFWRQYRGGAQDGLFHYDSAAEVEKRKQTQAKYESGWDTSVRWDDGIIALWPVDLNCYMVLFYSALAYMAERTGEAAEIPVWKEREKNLAREINTRLYDDSTQCYLDYNREKECFSPVLSPACFMPLYTGIASKEQAEPLSRLAADKNKFFPGMPTVSYDDPKYTPDDYWRGPLWLNVAFFALKGLKNYGYAKTADASRNTILSWCAQNDSAYEIYNSRTGQGLRTKDFGWSAVFIIELILGWEE